MKNAFIVSFKLKNTYRVNSIIYSIKQIPIINKLMRNNLYGNRDLKLFGNIISAIREIGGIFLGKLIYILIMITYVLDFYETNKGDTFIHMFIFLTLVGGLLNTFMFNPTKDKYYAMFIMNMDAKKYTLANYYYTLLKTFVGFLPFTIIFGLMSKLPLLICVLLSMFVIIIKLIVSSYGLLSFEKSNKVRNENFPGKITWISVAILLLIAYGTPLLGITINKIIFMILFILSFILGLLSFKKINKFNQYRKIYRQILTPETLIVQTVDSTKIMKDTVLKKIDFDENIVSNKNGFGFFHELFIKRHRKILTNAVKKQSAIIIICFIAVLIGTQLNSKFSKELNEILLMYLPYFVFLMYILNRGAVITQAMFMNCDHSMLTYRIYRTPKVILGLFKERLKTLIILNLLPSSIIAISLPILLFVTGGTSNQIDYIILFISIISMSIFFSTHYLIIYYLFQPYNLNTELKSGTYKMIQTITYFLCYFMIQLKLPIMAFGVTATIFCISYSIISLFLVYKFAPKTFKLRI